MSKILAIRRNFPVIWNIAYCRVNITLKAEEILSELVKIYYYKNDIITCYGFLNSERNFSSIYVIFIPIKYGNTTQGVKK